MLAWGITAGLPVPLLHTATRIVRDELDHAALAHTCLVALGGADAPIDLAAERLAVPAGEGLLADLARVVLRDFCLGETLAVPYFAEMRRGATHPAVSPVLDRVLSDEAVHRAFGWDALDALLALDPGVRGWAEARLPALVASFDGYRAPPDAPPLTDAERACGLLDNAAYGALFARTWAEDVAPRFARRGIGVGIGGTAS
ncbi:MAG: ferritin-like domain-containing protein [Myxococcota bacterium]